MKRGRKSVPCPDPVELRIAYAFDPRLVVVARQMGSGVKQVRRWLGELGIAVKPPKKLRPRGVVPTHMKVAWLASGKRHWVRLYGVWNAMRGRCNCPGIKDYKRYGARGIRVCEEWNDYDAFRAWAIKTGYRKHLTIDRIDVNGDYEPTNCEWIPKGEQQANTRWAIKLTVDGVTHSLYEWARIRGISADVLRGRVYSGWTHEQAVMHPIGELRPGVLRGRAAAKAKRIAACSSEGGR